MGKPHVERTPGHTNYGLLLGITGKTVYSELLFFFQAEDGIRDLTVTGVQTCALPICRFGRSSVKARSIEALPMACPLASTGGLRIARCSCPRKPVHPMETMLR